MTQEEKQSIVNDVLEAIRTNAVTIGQLTPVSGLSDADSFEISGGRRVDFKVLKNAVQNMPLKDLAKIEELLIQYGLSPQEKEMVKSSVVKAESAMEVAESAIVAAESAEAMAETMAESVGKASGIAPLDSAGVIPTRYIPGSMDDVKEFTEIMPTIKETSGTTDISSTSAIADVIYMPALSAFGLRVQLVGGGLIYYEKWGDDDLYNRLTLDGPRPLDDKLYVCKQTNMAYRWSGSTLVPLGSALALGYTSSTAFPGDEGLQLKGNLGTLADTVATFPKFLPIDGQLTKEYIDQDGREPESGVWLVPSPDEGCWYFQSYGDTDWYGHAEEEYNSDMQYIPGLMYLYKNQIATIENDTIKVMGSELVKAIQDADEAKVPGLYVLRNGEPLLVTREASVKTKTWTYTQLMLSDGGVVTRTATTPIPNVSGAEPSEIKWQDWQSLQGDGAIKVVDKAFIEKMEDSGVIEEGIFYVEGSGTLYLFSYNLADPCETKISHAGISYRTYKDGAWGNWVNKAEELAEAAKGAIYTEDSIDSLRKPQVYTLKDGSLLVVTRTIGDRITTYRQFHFADNGDILFRGCSNNAINWTAWQSIASVKTAQTTAEDALTTANKALADGVYIMFHRKSDNYPVLAHPEQWQSISQSGEVADGVLVMEAGLNVLVAPTDAGPDGMLVSNDAFPFNIYLNRANAMRDFNGSGFTAEMLAANDSANNLADKENAPGFCYAYYRDNGSGGGLGYNRSSGYGTWWMPSLAELMLIFAHKQKINYCLEMIPGAQKIREVWHHSSTMKANGLNWQFGMHNGNIDEWGPCYIARGAVRPVSTFII